VGIHSRTPNVALVGEGWVTGASISKVCLNRGLSAIFRPARATLHIDQGEKLRSLVNTCHTERLSDHQLIIIELY